MRGRGPKGLGSCRLRRRKDGTLALTMKVTVEGVDYVKTIDAPPKKKIVEAQTAFAAEVHSGAFAKQKEERKTLAGQPTLAEFAPVFLSSHVSQDPDRAATRTAYGNMLRLYVVPALGSHKLSEITTAMIRATVQELYHRGRAMGTLRLAFAVMHRCFDAAIEDGYLTGNPMPRFSKLHLGETANAAEHAKRDALSAAQVTALLNGCGADASLRLFVAVMASCGLRPGEANALRWQDVDLKASELHVRGSAKKVYGPLPGEGARVWIGKTKTPSSNRTVAIGPALASLFVAERERQESLQRELRGLPANIATAKPLLPDNGCVFSADPATAHGLQSPRSPDSLSAQFRRAAERAGLAHVSPHWLRHTAISHAIAEGTPLADASRRAGHKNPAITAAIYTHAVGEGEKKAAMIGDSLLSPASAADVEQISDHKGLK